MAVRCRVAAAVLYLYVIPVAALPACVPYHAASGGLYRRAGRRAVIYSVVGSVPFQYGMEPALAEGAGYPPEPQGRFQEGLFKRPALCVIIALAAVALVINGRVALAAVFHLSAEEPAGLNRHSLDIEHLGEKAEGVSLAYVRGEVYVPGEYVGKRDHGLRVCPGLQCVFIEGVLDGAGHDHFPYLVRQIIFFGGHVAVRVSFNEQELVVAELVLYLLEPAVDGEGLEDGVLLEARQVEYGFGFLDYVQYLGAGHIQGRHYLVEGVIGGELEVEPFYLWALLLGSRVIAFNWAGFRELLGGSRTYQEKYRKEK